MHVLDAVEARVAPPSLCDWVLGRAVLVSALCTACASVVVVVLCHQKSSSSSFLWAARCLEGAENVEKTVWKVALVQKS